MSIKKALSLVLVAAMAAALLIGCSSVVGNVYNQNNGPGAITITKYSMRFGEADFYRVSLNLGGGVEEFSVNNIQFMVIENEALSSFLSLALFFVPYQDGILNYRAAVGLIYNNYNSIRLGGNIYVKAT